MSVPLSLSGKVALITGGSRGIGAATVRLFTAADAKVVFSYQKARAQSEALAKECGEKVCYSVASNLDRPEAARVLVDETVKRFGRLDILVANHGVWPPQDVPIERMTDEQWRSTLSINLDAVFGLVKHAVSQMKAQSRSGPAAGHIVLISSTSGQRGEAFHCDYSATKGALISMVKGLSTPRPWKIQRVERQSAAPFPWAAWESLRRLRLRSCSCALRTPVSSREKFLT
jgi:3-oxoacyl-[acyl-carrier protein] reductase